MTGHPVLTAKPNSIQVIEAQDMRTGDLLQMFLIPAPSSIALQIEPRRGIEMTPGQARDLGEALTEWAATTGTQGGLT